MAGRELDRDPRLGRCRQQAGQVARRLRALQPGQGAPHPRRDLLQQARQALLDLGRLLARDPLEDGLDLRSELVGAHLHQPLQLGAPLGVSFHLPFAPDVPGHVDERNSDDITRLLERGPGDAPQQSKRTHEAPRRGRDP